MTWPANGAGHQRWAEAVHVSRQQPRIPAAPAEGWLSNGRQVLHFRPVVWERWQQELEVTRGEWLPDQEAPLLKRRQRLSREQAISLGRQKHQEDWSDCAPQWKPPQPLGWTSRG